MRIVLFFDSSILYYLEAKLILKSDLIVLLLICISSLATFLTSPIPFYTGYIDAGIVIFLFLVIKYSFQGRTLSLSLEFILIIAIWITINVLAGYVHSSKPVNERVVRYTISLLLFPSLVIVYTGDVFWKRFEKIVYFLTKLSLPLYFLNIIFAEFFDSLSSVFHPLTYSQLATGNYWSAIVYTNSIWDSGGGYFRNAGFMWEPGAFALMIVIGAIVKWLSDGVKWDTHFIVYFIAMLTTFSTSGYLAIFLLFTSIFLKKISLINLLIFTSVFAIGYIYVYQLDFIGGEIEQYTQAYQDDRYYYDSQNYYYKANRFLGAYYDLEETIDYPLGYGLISKNDFEGGLEITGVSGLSNLLKMWGIPMFIYFLFLLWRFLKYLNKSTDTPFQVMLTMFIALLIMLFSNPVQRNVVFYIMILTPVFLVPKTVFTGKANECISG